MRVALLASLAIALVGCNAINGFADLEKVDCVGEGCAPDSGADSFAVDTEAPDTELPDTAPDDTSIDDGDASDTADTAIDVPDTSLCSSASKACYSGPMDTAGKGACVQGTQHCVDGDYGPCVGEVKPTLESCNGIDDDCNGSVDDDLPAVTCGVGACKVTKAACTAGAPTACVPGTPGVETCNGIDDDCDGSIDEEGCSCIYVTPTGLDTNDGSAATPLKTINAGIAKAAAGTIKRVCVASSATCGTTVDFAEAVVMKNGVSVYGGYQATGTIWPRTAGCITRITALNARGVYFDAAIKSTTILDGFTVAGGTQTSNAAITVEGSTGAVINNVVVTGGAGSNSIGVDILESGETRATPTISRSNIHGGTGSATAIGVKSYRSTPTLQDLCDTFDSNGRCNVASPCAATGLQVRGRANITGTTARSYGVFLTDSPGAVIARSTICGGSSSTESNGVRLAGDLTGTRLVSSSVRSGGSLNAVGVLVDGCGDGSPWLFNNFDLAGETSSTSGRADGVRAVGACHPRIDSNVTIVGGRTVSTTTDARGVYCGATVSPSLCVINNNGAILGSTSTFVAAFATGVQCDNGACARIDRNGRIAAASATAATSAGISLAATGTWVHDNLVETGCATKEGGALLSRDSFARVDNNVLRGLICSSTTSANSFAAKLLFTTTRNEPDLHSNTLFAQGYATTCTSRALWLDIVALAPPSGPRGLFRNNIFNAGVCSTSYHVDEAVAAADPRVFKNNDLWSAPVTALYRDEATNNLISIGTVNALTDMIAADNLSADPVFTTAYHIGATSACRDKGTSEGAPPLDFDGDLRPLGAAHDIGADEFKP